MVSYRNEVILNIIFTSLGMLLSYLLVKVTYIFLGVNYFGVYQVILTLITWLAISNFGLSNGLRNKIAESLAKNNKNAINSYIVSAYVVILAIAVLLLLLGMFLIKYIDLQLIFNSANDLDYRLIRQALYIFYAGFCMSFVLGVGNSIALGFQKSSLPALGTMLVNLLFLILLIIFIKVKGLIFASYSYTISNLVVNIVFTLYIFNKFNLKFSLKLFNVSRLKETINLGVGFFVIQICGLILFSTDSFLISSFISVESVSQYVVYQKLFLTIQVLFGLLLSQLWSATSFRFHIQDINWIRDTLKKLLFVWLGCVISVIILCASSDIVISMWMGKSFVLSVWLAISFTFYIIVSTHIAIYANILNGMGKLKWQIIFALFMALANIPLSLLMILYFNFGNYGVIIATTICMLPAFIFQPYLVKKELGLYERAY